MNDEHIPVKFTKWRWNKLTKNEWSFPIVVLNYLFQQEYDSQYPLYENELNKHLKNCRYDELQHWVWRDK